MTEDYNLYPLHVFRLVAQLGSVTRAAQELFISQPAVSAHLKTVETKYGEALFERTPRGMTLTPAGAALHEHVGRLFALYEGVTTAIADMRGEVRGEIVVAASSTPGAYLVPGLLRDFQQRYPAAQPILRVGDSAEVLAWLHDYRVAIGVIGEMAITEDLERVEIGSDKLQLVVAADDALVRVRQIKLEHLQTRTLFLREPGSSTRAGSVELLGEFLSSFARTVELNSTEAIKQSVATGSGVAVLSSWTTRLEEAAGLLQPVKDTRFRLVRKFYLVKRKDRTLVGSAAAMWSCLTENKSR
ncbi:MAG TPA: LysR family transcriptional regulator [Blastocatellia bacterium]|nr:LysR family transcriptional regulator [Blastocatellia bacterium]